MNLSWVNGYIQGAPELIVEVAASTVSYDLHEKLNAYRRNGVTEYVVWRREDRAIDWFVLIEDVFNRLPLTIPRIWQRIATWQWIARCFGRIRK